MLLAGNYTITLLDGWFMERVGSGSSGSGGGTATGGTTGKGGSTGTGGRGGRGGKGGSTSMGSAGEFDQGGETGSSGGSSGTAGSIGEGGSGPVEGSTTVDAFLLSDAVQFFSLFGGDDAFVNYQFQIGGEVIDFGHGRLHVGIDVIEDPSVCQSPEGVIDPRKVLIETNLAALDTVSLFDVLGALASNGGMNADPLLIHQKIYDSYASAENGRLSDAIHCDDQSVDGTATLNGFRIDCDRVEVRHFDDPENFFPTAFVNRMDLAPENGAHCGQQRIIFANNELGGRAFLIFEAQIPNPAPDLGIEGCRPLAQFWLEQNDISDPAARGARLAQAFISGDPGLVAQGFGPFYTAANLTVGSGQIRTNQFDQSPWTLREFKLALDGDNLSPIPFPTSEAPNGALWNEGAGLAQGPGCRASFLSAVDQLLTNDLSEMSFVVDSVCNDAESRNDFSQDYDSQLSNGFRSALEERLAGTGLNADDLANRAQFAGSCIGCHNESSGRFLGNGVFAPFSNDFVQVQEQFVSECPKGEGLCFEPSQGLTEVFLPSRLQVLGRVLDMPIIADPCDPNNGGTGGTSGSGGTSAGTAGVSSGAGPSMGGRSSGGRTGTSGSSNEAGAAPIAQEPVPAPEIVIEIPQADEPVEDMQEADQEIRKEYGERTLSGRSARTTH